MDPSLVNKNAFDITCSADQTGHSFDPSGRQSLPFGDLLKKKFPAIWEMS